MPSSLLAIRNSFRIQSPIWPAASLHRLPFLSRTLCNPNWFVFTHISLILQQYWKYSLCALGHAIGIGNVRRCLWIRTKRDGRSEYFQMINFYFKSINYLVFFLKEMFGHRPPKRRIPVCSRNLTKLFLVLITRAKVWSGSILMTCFHLQMMFS